MELIDLDAWSMPWRRLMEELGELFPRALSAVLLLAAGALLSWAAGKAAQALLRRAGSDRQEGGAYLFRVWSLRHPGQAPSQGLGGAVAFAAFILFCLGAAHLLGGTVGRELLDGLLHAAPRLLTVLLLLMVAVLLAAGVGLLALGVLGGWGSRHAFFWSRVAAWGVFTGCALFALEPLGLAGQLLGQAVLILLGGAALGLGLAFGLGCKDLARELVLELLKPDKGEGA